MRRSKQRLSRERCIEILKTMTSGVLSLNEDNSCPYQVPLSYSYFDDSLIFHSALEGKKIDLIKKDNRSSFLVIGKDEVQPERTTTLYESVSVTGRIEIIGNDTEKRVLIKSISNKYSPSLSEDQVTRIIDQSISSFVILRMRIESITGKASLSFVR